jgi:hypothetical protein
VPTIEKTTLNVYIEPVHPLPTPDRVQLVVIKVSVGERSVKHLLEPVGVSVRRPAERLL